MNTIMVVVLKVLFPYGLSLRYILIHSVIFQNGPTNICNSSKGVLVPYSVPLFHLGGGWGATINWYQSQGLCGSSIEYRIEKHVSSNMLS